MSGALVYEKAVSEDLDIGTGTVDITNPGGGKIRGTRVNLGTLAQLTYSASWAPGSIASLGAVVNILSIPGATLGDFVKASFASTSFTSDLVLFAYVSDTDAVTVVMRNHNITIPVNPGTATLRVLVHKTNL